MKRMFIKMLPVMAAVLLATSCSKEDGNDAAIDTPIDNPQQTEVVSNVYKTVTINGKVGKTTLSKVSVDGSAFKFDGGGTEIFKFGVKDETDVYGDITINDADGNFTATLNYSSEKALIEGDFTATFGSEPKEKELGTGYGNLATAVKNAYYVIPFNVVKDGEAARKYKLTERSLSKAEPSYDVKVYVQAAFIMAQGPRTIKLDDADVTVTANKYYVVRVGAKMGSTESNKTVAGTVYTVKATDYLPGAFTINASGDKVHFAKGNLQYNVSDKEWRFADHQYDFIGGSENGMAGNVSGNTNTNLSGPWIDLFGWVGNSSNWNEAPQKYGVTTSQSYNAADGYGTEATESLKSDWGANFGDGKTWRTLTGGSDGQWKYLLDTRTTKSGVRYAKAQLNGINGLIIVPDDWENKSPYNLASYNTYGADFTTNKISSENWDSWESAGAVFLPAAGGRNGSTVGDVGTRGSYWALNAYGNNTAAHNVNFTDHDLYPHGLNNRRYGYSVRLVRSL